MKFDEFFNEVQFFTNGSYVVSGYLDKDVALKMIEKEVGHMIQSRRIRSDYVRFGFPPKYVEEQESFDSAIWYTGASGKGSLPVWVYFPELEE